MQLTGVWYCLDFVGPGSVTPTWNRPRPRAVTASKGGHHADASHEEIESETRRTDGGDQCSGQESKLDKLNFSLISYTHCCCVFMYF